MRESIAVKQANPEAAALCDLVRRASRLTDAIYLAALRHYADTFRDFPPPDLDVPFPSVRGTYALHLAGRPHRASCAHGCILADAWDAQGTPTRCEHGQPAWLARYFPRMP